MFYILLFTIAILSRIPYMPNFLYYWDSVNFALGIHRYNVSEFRPSPPGNFVYVFLTKPIYMITHDANLSFLIINLLATGFGAIAIYLFSKKLFNKPSAIAASLLFLSSPAIYFHSLAAFTYMLDGCFIMFLAYFAYLSLTEIKLKYAILSAIFLGLSAGARQQDIVLLFPLFLYGIHKQKFKNIIISILTLAIVCFSWAIPMIYLSGGVKSYISACKIQAECGEHGNILILFNYWVRTGGKLLRIISKVITIGLIPLIIIAIINFKKIIRDKKTIFFAFWIIPCLLFWFNFHLSNLGHTFTCIWAIFPILAYALYVGTLHATSLQKIIFLCVFVNIIVFFFDPKPHKPFKNKTWYQEADLRKRNDFMKYKIQYIKENFSPSDTIILADTGGSGNLAQAGYYLPEFSFYHLNALIDKGKFTVLFTKNREYVKVIDETSVFSIPNAIKNIVLFDEIYPKYLVNSNIMDSIYLDKNIYIQIIKVNDKNKIKYDYKKWEII